MGLYIAVDFGTRFSLEEAQRKRNKLQEQQPKTKVYLLDEYIKTRIEEKNFSELEEKLNATHDINQILQASTPAQEALILAHTYIQQERLEEALNQTRYSPKLNQAKAIMAFSNQDYGGTLTNLTTTPSTELHETTRMLYVVALQQEGVDLTKQDKKRLLGPAVDKRPLAKRLYNEDNTTLTLPNPYETVQKVLSK